MSFDLDQSKKLIHCSPGVAYIPSVVSNKSEESTESLEWFYENLEMENRNFTAGSEYVCLTTTRPT